jgi:hypothetical protein
MVGAIFDPAHFPVRLARHRTRLRRGMVRPFVPGGTLVEAGSSVTHVSGRQ